jgi:hypothetical protein
MGFSPSDKTGSAGADERYHHDGCPAASAHRRNEGRGVTLEVAFNARIDSLRCEAVAETGVDRPIMPLGGKAARRSRIT